MVSALLLATLLTLSDPTGDAVGNGTLAAPTASAFRGAETFDIRAVSVPDAETFGFTLEFALLPPPDTFPQAITELYLHDAEAAASGRPGRTSLLPGSGMRLPEGRGWHLAFRVVGGDLQVFSPDGADAPDAFPDEVTDSLGARAVRQGNSLIVTTELPVPARFNLYGMTGAYDPFSETGWRALRAEPSPWGFSSLDQQVPVLDVIGGTYAQQQGAINRGVLPEIRASFVQEGWLLLAGAGVVVALAGLGARFWVRRETLRDARSHPSPSPTPPLAPPSPALRLAALQALAEGRATLSLPSNRGPSQDSLPGTATPPAAPSDRTDPHEPEAAASTPPQPAKRLGRVLVVRRPEVLPEGESEASALEPAHP